MLKFIFRRICFSVFTLLVISFLMFFITSHVSNFMMGDMLERYVSPADRDYVAHTVEIYITHEESNWLIRYGVWLTHVLRGKWGYSILFKMPVWDVLLRSIENTLLLTTFAFVLSWVISLPLGIYTAINNRKIKSQIATTLGFVGLSIPEFFLALLGIYFAYHSGIFPIGGIVNAEVVLNGKWYMILLSYFHHLILPGFLLASLSIAKNFKIIKGELQEEFKKDYTEFAISKGLPKKYILFHHNFRNVLNPLCTNLGFQFATLLTGSLFIEFLFSINGIGTLTIRSINFQDQPVAMASLFASAVLLIIGNLVADILLAYIDPRIRFQMFKWTKTKLNSYYSGFDKLDTKLKKFTTKI